MTVDPARGVLIATVNLHLPPSQPANRRRAVLSDAAVFPRTGAGICLLDGDLNIPLGLHRGCWFSKAMSAKGLWVVFRNPYLPGQPTNMVWQVGRPSKRGFRWVLLSTETPCGGAEQQLLPGLSTHLMLECD